LTVELHGLTEATFIIDEVSTLVLGIYDDDGTALVGIPVHITGERIIGLGNPLAVPPVPDYLRYTTHDFVTDASGLVMLDPLDWDTYTVVVEYGVPYGDQERTIELVAGEDKTVDIRPNNLEIFVRDSSSADPIIGAEVTLMSNPPGSYEQTMLTDVGGIARFESLLTGDYKYTVLMTGYIPIENQDIVIIAGDQTVTVDMSE
jgi:hypothetical protein